ncbi:MAG: hypothetical protein QM778_14185 [Myxococcales bacterium]
MSTRQLRFWSLLSWSLACAACGGANNYNFARSYEPLRAEKAHYLSAQAVPLEDVKRDPNGFQTTEIGWFGVVRGLRDLGNGKTRVSMELHAHHERHLCSEQSSSSCRLTIAERDLGSFDGDLMLKPEEKKGPDHVAVGSLLKVYGHPTGEYADDGGPVLDVSYFRHWPRGTYVTTADRGTMRR